MTTDTRTTTAAGPDSDNPQQTLWNGPAGQAWVQAQTLLDQLFKPFEEHLIAAVEAVEMQSLRRVLDIGCGTGGTTLAVAQQLGAQGQCTGIDLSQPMINLARQRVAQLPAIRREAVVNFICADAQDYAFQPATYDSVISRFGVMFFNNAVQAFSNLRQAVTDNGRLHCIVWRSAADNPFMTTAERAAAPLLLDLPAREPDAPGQFAFADRQRVYRILEQSGWQSIEIQPVDLPCSLPAAELTRYISLLGPVGLVLQRSEESIRQRVIDTVRSAFAPYVDGDEVRFNAACWVVMAHA